MAYRSVLIVTLTQPDLNDSDLVTFSEEVKRRAKIQYGYVFGPDEHVSAILNICLESIMKI
ncbi:hypothetical protein DPMN_104398 [Dreissena polymorpha]|uniref:Uncharacterized protein n=1 Tax=Dreissena polymorpha TaxID=45954 RepID=A0A9D4H7P6_DREPO|nr:hypothetical protein DPMN_104398 [Dreissena polymorpha]